MSEDRELQSNNEVVTEDYIDEETLASQLSKKSAEGLFEDLLSAVTETMNGEDIEQIKKAYKKMALKHHPDRVEALGADVRKAAEEKFKAISVAYETIKKERGFN